MQRRGREFWTKVVDDYEASSGETHAEFAVRHRVEKATFDHECGWKKIALELAERISELDARLTAIQRQVFGKKSEKMPPMDREVRKARPVDKAAVLERRRKNAELRASGVKTEDVAHRVPEAERRCPKCGKGDLKAVGKGKESIEWNYVPGCFRRCRHVRETLACSCGQYIVTAPGPDHSVENTRYGDGLRAYIVTSKCADSLPVVVAT